jgi:hypothetical protein
MGKIIIHAGLCHEEFCTFLFEGFLLALSKSSQEDVAASHPRRSGLNQSQEQHSPLRGTKKCQD